MIKSVNQLITEKCNSRCIMCSIWKLKKKSYEMTPKEFNSLYSKPEFKEVEDLCISGGEPTLRKDLFEVTDNIIKNLPKLRMLFLSTNGSNPFVIKDFMKRYYKKIKEIYLCISLEGDRETNKKIRGVDSYESVIKTIKEVNSLDFNNLKVILSTTIVPENCNKKSLDHIRKLAKELKCTFSFRIASKNNTFYHNAASKKILLNKKQKFFLKEYMSLNNIRDPFLDILFAFLNGEEIIVGSRKKGIRCLAGDISVFIKPNGNIYPCINSSRLIGDKNRGVFKYNYKLGSKELCPCCTECQIYPLLNFSQYSNKNEKKK